jgi:hypothetical protein
MYRGNMYEFAEKLFQYVKRNYSATMELRKSGNHPGMWYICCDNVGLDYPYAYGTDSEDFEEQLFKATNYILEKIKNRKVLR